MKISEEQGAVLDRIGDALLPDVCEKWRAGESLDEGEERLMVAAIMREQREIDFLQIASGTVGPVRVFRMIEGDYEDATALGRQLKEAVQESADYLERIGRMLAERDVSTGERKTLKKRKLAMGDDSYPIANAGDLRNAMRAVGRAKPGKRAAVKAHIRRAAKHLGLSKLLSPAFGGT